MKPTGALCTVSNDTPAPVLDDDQCIQDGTLTQCVTKDGILCTSASNGKQFCWDPSENGIKTSGNEAASKVPQGKESKPPPVPPKNGGEWEKVGETNVTIEERNGDTTKTSESTLSNYNSSYGSKGGGASGGGAKGEPNGGSGDGSGGSGGGDGDGDGEGDEAGGVGPGAGDFYTGKGRTVAQVYGDFKTRVSGSPFVSSVGNFFNVNVSGTCPVFTVPASTYWEEMTYNGHCSGDFLATLRALGWVLMAFAALAAVYWALA